jgi:sterol desaturase/sphingolipid hydroxylase (fatty acid hydroxylase superfamily)
MVMLASVQSTILVSLSFCLTAICTHLVISGGQTFLHCWVGHRRLGRVLYRNHIKFHHAYYARGHLVSAIYRSAEGNNTPFFLIPTLLVGAGMFFLLPLQLFLVSALIGAASFYAHVFLDKEYHVENSKLQRFAWFRRKQQLHFVHHLHADKNFAVINFFWDRLIGSYQSSETDLAELDSVVASSQPVENTCASA